LNGAIRARDSGDARLTSYFYTFQGNQGDVFMNVVTKNFNGDIDVFLAEGLKPLTKVPIYDDNGETETGRIIYLRKPERLILRIEGRTPNDDPATYQIKFAGSFEASKDAVPDGSDLPKVENVAESNIRVNSVGTIIAVIPKPKPTPKPSETIAEKNADPARDTQASTKPEQQTPEKAEAETSKPEVVVTENVTAAEKAPLKMSAPANTRGRRTAVTPKRKVPTETTEEATVAEPPPASSSRTARITRPKTLRKSAEPDPLTNIHLVIEFKDGRRVERPMSEVLRFSVDRGVLTVISKDGTVGRYPILEVARTTIQ
jgi:hypothetical protein